MKVEERPGGKSRYGERLLHKINSMMFRTTVGGEIEKFRPLLRLWVGLDREHPHSFVDQLNCAQVGKYDLSGYLAYGKPILQRRNNKEYSIQKYQGEHNNEYTVMEMENGVPNGLAQLFKKGVIQMSWIMKNGVRYGSVTIYKNGVVERVTTWDSLNDAASARKDALLREVVNDVNRSGWMVEKVASTGLIVYRGGYNRADLTKEGWGFKYSKKSGLEKSYGYYRNDKLVHICQEFITGEDGTRMMIEYGGDVNDDNVSEVLNCQPIYIGGYSFNVGKGEYVRSGKGHVINESSGICDQLGEWDQEGKEMGGQQQVLHGGWYHEVDWYPSIRVNKIDFNGIINGQQYVQGNGDGDGHGDGHGDDKKDGHRKGGREGREGDFLTEGRPSIQLALSSDSILMNNCKIESFSISNNSYNGSSTDDVKMELTLSNLPQLKYVDIGANSFQRVRSLRFEHLDSLESIHIGKDCFRISAQDRWKSQRQDGLFSIQNCPKLRSVALGNNSFFDFEVFEITKVKSLRSIEFGAQCFFFGNCIMQDLPSLETVVLKRNTFQNCQVAIFENLLKLHTISFIDAEGALYGDGRRTKVINNHESRDNTLIMRNLPALTTIRCQGNCGYIHRNMGYVIIENIPNLIESKIGSYGDCSFEYTADLQAKYAPSLETVIRKLSKLLHK